MTTRTQLYGFTGPTPATGYVKFIAVFEAEACGVLVSIRNEKCEFTEIYIPASAAKELADVLTAYLAKG